MHHSQVSEEVAFDQGDDDADKIAAMEYFFPVGEKVIFLGEWHAYAGLSLRSLPSLGSCLKTKTSLK